MSAAAPVATDAARAAVPVAINARAAVRDELGGVERYAVEMASRLFALGGYRVLAPRRRLRHRAGHLWEQFALPLAARGCGLIYSPANLAPACSRRSVVVIHDVAALVHPEAYSAAYVAYQRALLPLVARGARQVVTVSSFSLFEIADRLAVPAERIAVIPGGVDLGRFNPAADAAPAARALGLRGGYVLAVGTASARKNHAALEPAALALCDRGIELVVAGSDRSYLRAGRLGGTAGATGGSSGTGRVRRLGYVPEALLPGLYSGALALAMPSLHEGFGLPCLEAMASGTPVVAARAGALPETCGDAALLVDPGDGFADALLALAEDRGAGRARLIDAGLRRAAAFGWDRTARATDALLRGLLG